MTGAFLLVIGCAVWAVLGYMRGYVVGSQEGRAAADREWRERIGL